MVSFKNTLCDRDDNMTHTDGHTYVRSDCIKRTIRSISMSCVIDVAQNQKNRIDRLNYFV